MCPSYLPHAHLCRKRVKESQDRLDRRDLRYLSGFGFIGGRVGRTKARSGEKRKKRDSIVGIGQWGRKKRFIDSSHFKKR